MYNLLIIWVGLETFLLFGLYFLLILQLEMKIMANKGVNEMSEKNVPAVLLIYTGGTIGMIENPETGALESFNFEHLQNHVPELKRFNYHIATYQFTPPIDSSDMEPALWAKLVHIINDNYDKFDGFVFRTYDYFDFSFVISGKSGFPHHVQFF